MCGFHFQWCSHLGGEVGLEGYFLMSVEGRSWLGGVCFSVFYDVSFNYFFYIRHLCFIVFRLSISVHLVQRHGV